ncbi:hypothetical protein Q31b_16580 [Novipirellula aureliae]|uniref:EF-hand domain-containing protein n=1 Tax=Novipirellula aureliae TaxID=2527966 RepID=A0A5C6E384_9BACT|nr:dockerin type I domain-containing protein [Novipirellula aureliae]TWU44123.1 hypothetical protein Q31b_16580 [Novipirellula aureliae]
MRISSPEAKPRRSRSTRRSHANRRRFSLEQLEARQMLAAFIVNEPLRNVELQRSGNHIQVVNAANNTDVILSVAADDIDNDQITIAAASLIVDSAVNLDGNSLTVQAGRIELSSGTITTDDTALGGDAGDVNLTALQIMIGPGSTIDTRSAAGGLSDGTVALTASDRPDDLAGEFRDLITVVDAMTRAARIDLSGATIRGRDVTLKADGITSTRWDDVGAFKDNVGTQLTDQLNAIPQIGLSMNSPISGQVKVHFATAEIGLLNSTINSSTSVTIGATAAADASINAVAINGTGSGGSKILVSIAMSTSDSTATVGLEGTTNIIAAGRVDVTTNATSKAKVVARADANGRSSSKSVEGAFNIAGALTGETSRINLASGASIVAGDTVNLDAKGNVENNVKATTSVFQDGTGGLSLSVGVDFADIISEVHGTITSGATGDGSRLSVTAANVDAANDRITFNAVPASLPIKVGERIEFSAGSGDLGLIDGKEYIVHDVTAPVASTAGNVSQTVRLVAAESIDLDSRQVPNDSTHTLKKIAIIKFNQADVSREAGSGDGLINLATLPASVTQIVYLGPDIEVNEDATAIAGLIQNQAYDVVRVAGKVKLQLPGTTTPIDFVAPETSTHGFYFTESLQSFSPNTDVNNDRETITLPAGHGLETGDLVFYGTDPTRTILRDIKNFGTGNTSIETLGTVSLPDAPIDGLENQYGYRVVIDPGAPNQIRLTTSLFAATAASIQDLNANSGTGHAFSRGDANQGVIMNASLIAFNGAEAGVTLSDAEQPWAEVAIGAASGQVDRIATGGYALINGMRTGVNNNSVDKGQEQTGSSASTRETVDLASSTAVMSFNHDVYARIMPTAVVTSAADLIVDGKIEQKTKLTSTSSATRRGVDDNEAGKDPQEDGDTEISLAIGVGIYDNDSDATILSGATTDANDQTIVKANVDYPMLVESVTSAINPLEILSSGGLNGIGSMLDGKMGLSQLFNVQIATVAGSSGDKFVLAGGIGVTDFTNRIRATIDDNALVNQNVDLSTNDPSVSVLADLTGVQIEVGQMASYNLDIKGFAEALIGSEGSPTTFLKQLANPFGVSGKNAAGGVLLLTLADNETIASIGSGAKVIADGAVTVKATSDYDNLAVVQTGAASTSFGFSASIVAADIDNKTHAFIADGAIITAGSLNVAATDTLNRIAIAGAILKGKQTGIGASVGVNLIDQDVAAYVGRASTIADAVTRLDVTLNISGAVDVTAKADGDLFALVMAGAVQGFGNTPASGAAGGATTNANAKKIGPIALTIPVAINNVTTNVSAYIDHQKVRSLDANVKADSMVEIQSVIIGASFGIQTEATGNGKLNLAGAGAVGINTVVQNLAAFIKDSDVETTGGRGINVKTDDKSSVSADAGGFGIALSTAESSRAAISFGVSFALNDISGNNTATINDSVINVLAGNIDVEVMSTSIAKALSIAGGVSVKTGPGSAGSFGGAGAVAINDIGKTMSAGIVNNGNVTTAAGKIDVHATDMSDIDADAGGFGIGISGGSGNSIAGAVGISVALNEIGNTIEAKIDGSNIDTKGQVDVIAHSSGAKIRAVSVAASAAGAVGGGVSVALSGAGSGANNAINNQILASISDSTVNVLSGGGVSVQALDTSSIVSTAVGAAIGVAVSGSTGVGLAVGISIAFNDIGIQATASVVDSTVTIDGFFGFDVLANQSASITSTAVAASVAAGFGTNGVGVSGAGAGAVNKISNKTIAKIDGSDVTVGGNVSVLAKDNATIESKIVAAAAAIGAGTTGVGAAFGFSYAENRIGDADTFSDDPTAIGAPSAAQVKAYINESSVTSGATMDVRANSTGSITSDVSAFSVAAAGGANAVAIAGAGVSSSNDVAMEIASVIQDSTGSGIKAAELTLLTEDSSTITTTVTAASLAVALGAFSGAVTVAVSGTTANIENKVQSAIRRSTVLAEGSVRVLTTENVNANATATAASASTSIGLSLAGGGAIASGTIASIVSSEIADSRVTTYGELSVDATNTATSDIQTASTTRSIGVIGLAANGSSAISTITPDVDVAITGSSINAGTLGLNAKNNPLATADAAGLSVSTGAAIGVSIARVNLGGSANALLESAGRVVNVDRLVMSATNEQEAPSRAFAQGSAGGLLIGVDATVTSATNLTNVNAVIAANSVVNAIGDMTITAKNFTNQDSDSSSLAIGLIAAGITRAGAKSDVSTIARIHSGAQVNAGSLTLQATGRDQNIANTTSGAGGAISGAVALPITNSFSNVLSEIADDAQVNVIGLLRTPAKHVAVVNSRLTAAAGGLLSGSGGELFNEVVSHVVSRVGDRAKVTAGSMEATARNEISKADLGKAGNVDATTGGLFAGVGVVSNTNLSLTTLIDIGDGAIVTVGDSVSAHLDMTALNVINVTDQLTLRSGGLAAGGSNNASIRTLVDEAEVAIGANAKLSSTGTITASARGQGVVTIQANAETYGAVTEVRGGSTISVMPTNTVMVAAGANLTADRDIHLSSGTDTASNRDLYTIHSRVDTFAGSLIPLDTTYANADLIQDNQVTVSSGAVVQSAGNIRLHAERFGDNEVIAQVKAVNDYNAPVDKTNGVDGLFAAGGIEQFKGNAISSASGIVTIEGTVRTGIKRNQVLEIQSVTRANVPADTPDSPDLYTVVLAGRSTDGIGFTKKLTPVTSSLDIALAEAYRNLGLYSTNGTSANPELVAFYNNEITRINDKLAAQGLLDTSTGTEVPVSRETLTLVIDPVIAQAGSIDIVADERLGSGTLDAPGDASVEIINRSFVSLELSGIEIPDQTGGVFLNSKNVTAVASAVPLILVDNVADVTSPSLTNNGSLDLTWPNISLNSGGAIKNLGGDVTLRNFQAGAGNILVNGTILASTPRIFAGTQGAASFNAGDNNSAPYSTGGEAYKNWNKLSRDGLGVDGQPLGPGSGMFPPTEASLQDYLNQSPDQVNIFGNRIFVTAQYINLNGVMQSGNDEYNLVIGDATNVEIESLRSSSGSEIRDLTSVSDGNFILQYDFGNDRILVQEVRSGGGYIDLTGSISNTHNGELRVLGGYSRINIDNQTDHDIELKRLDVSERGDGVVIIKDFNKGSETNPGVSIYQVEGNNVYAQTPEGTDTRPRAFTFQYKPKDGLRYGWSVAQDLATRTETIYRSTNLLGIKVPTNIFSQHTDSASSPRLLESGAYFYTDTNAAIGDYDFNSSLVDLNDKTTSGGNRYLCSIPTAIGCLVPATYETTEIRETGTRFIATHSVDADRPVDIKFLGQNEGAISIHSGGTVFVSGSIGNVSGQTSITSDKGVVQLSPTATVGGRIIRIKAGDAIGSVDTPLLTNITDRLPSDFVSDRGAVGTTTTVGETQYVLVAAGHTAGGTPGSVYRYKGTRESINLRNEDFSNTAKWFELTLEANIGLQTTSDDITVREVQGNMPVEVVAVSAPGVPSFAGNVSLTAQDSIVYGFGRFSPLSSFVVGTSVNLVAETGSIGSMNDPFQAASDFLNVNKNPGNNFNAKAAGDIWLELSEAISVDTIEAGGDVHITFDAFDGGSLIDGNTVAVRDERAIEDVAAMVWSDLQLTVDLGANEKRNERIEAIAATQTQSYQAYWNFRSQQADPAVYDPNFGVMLVTEERAFYEQQLREQGTGNGLAGDELNAFVTAGITTLEANRSAQYHDLHDDWGPLGDAFDPEFRYTLTAEETKAIDDTTKIWTVEELLNLQSAAFLNVTDTEFVIEEPNIIGVNIYLDVPDGIGQYQNGYTIERFAEDGSPNLLTIEERAAIAAAEPGDIVFLKQAPSQVVAEIQDNAIILTETSSTWSSLGFVIGDFVHLETNTRDTTDDGVFFEIQSLDNQTMRLITNDRSLQNDSPRPILVAPVIAESAARDSATHIRVLRREDIDVNASGTVSAESTRHIFLGSETDMTIDGVWAGGNERLQIKVGGSLNTTDALIVDLIGGRIVLEAARGNIGLEDDAVFIDSSEEGYLIARAQKEIVIIEENVDFAFFPANLHVNQVFSKESFVNLSSYDGILDALGTDETNVRGTEINLLAQFRIGTETDFLDIDLIGEGTLTAAAESNIQISETNGNLNLRQIYSANAHVSLVADGSILDAVDVENPYDPTSDDVIAIPGNPAMDIYAGNISLVAKHGSIGVAGNELDIKTSAPYLPEDQYFSLTTSSALNTYIIETIDPRVDDDGVPFEDNDLYLNTVTTDGATAFITAPGGSIFNALPDGQVNVSSGKAWLFALQSIGTPDKPIRTKVGSIEGQAYHDTVDIINEGDLIIGGVMEPFGDSFAGKGLDSRNDLNLSVTGSIQIDEFVSSFFKSTIRTPGSLTVGVDGGIWSDEEADLIVETDPNAPTPAMVDFRGTVISKLVRIQTGGGNDQIVVAPKEVDGALQIESGAGDDEIETNGQPATIDGGAGKNVLKIFGGGTHLDLSKFADNSIKSFDTIDMRGTRANRMSFAPGKIVQSTPGSPIELLQGSGDKVDFGVGWKPEKPQLIGGLFTHIISDGTAKFQVRNAAPYLNPANPLDVNSSGGVSASDAIIIINLLSNRVLPDLSAPITAQMLATFNYIDTNHDGKLSASDALAVINFINEPGTTPAPVGEKVIATLAQDVLQRAERKRFRTAEDEIPRELIPTQTIKTHLGFDQVALTETGEPWWQDDASQEDEEDALGLEETIGMLVGEGVKD